MGKLRMGMVGGGEGSFIGAVHRIAAQLDNEVELVSGVFSHDTQNSLRTGKSLYLDSDRCYSSYQEMFESEAQKPQSVRMDFVSIVTPNHLHFPVAKMAFQYGFHVMSDKPATLNLTEVLVLEQIIKETGLIYGLSHTYTGYPMIKEARARVAQGQLGEIIKIIVEYPQGWLAGKGNEETKQATWRLDPKYAGNSGCMADIGVHAFNLAEYVSGLEVTEVCADISASSDTRQLDDDGVVLMRFSSGATGILFASQIAVGEENHLKLRIYGSKASLEWSQQEPNSLWINFNDESRQMVRTGVGQVSRLTELNTRIPAGHPEGYLEAFANIYRSFTERIRAELQDCSPGGRALDLPSIKDAIRGMAFIENVVVASQSDIKWHPFSLKPLL